MSLTIDPRYCGPDGSGNGGYTCGIVAAQVDCRAAEVTLHSPPPLGRPLTIRRSDSVTLWDDNALVASAQPCEVELELPEAVTFAEAEAARLPHGDLESPYPNCFVCGRARSDGLRLFPGRVPGRALVATPWVPAAETIGREFVWAALDCPGAYGAGALEGRGQPLLGRLAARVDGVPDPGERCVVLGWGLGKDGRKVYAGTAVFGEDGRVIGYARATWILPRT